MSKNQSPIAALCAVASIAALFSLARGFSQILNIYFLAAALLFGLAYGSLIVFRVREAKSGLRRPEVFRCPGGVFIAVFLILVQTAMAALIIYENPKDSRYTLGLLLCFAALYLFWRRPSGAGAGTGKST